MLKKVLLLICMLFLPVYAGVFEDALEQNDNVFLYIYTTDCGTCTQFMPKYEKLKKLYGKNYGFVKVDANEPYGSILMSTLYGKYVPFVVLVSAKHRIAAHIDPSCLMDNICVEKALKDFQNQK